MTNTTVSVAPATGVSLSMTGADATSARPAATSTNPPSTSRSRISWWPALLAFVSAAAATAMAARWLAGSRILVSVQGGWLEDGLTYGGWVTTAVLVSLVALRGVVALSALALFRPVGRFGLHRTLRIVGVLSGFGLALYGLAMVVYGILTIIGLVGTGPLDWNQLLWSTGVWHLWEAATGMLILLAAHRTRGANN